MKQLETAQRQYKRKLETAQRKTKQDAIKKTTITWLLNDMDTVSRIWKVNWRWKCLCTFPIRAQFLIVLPQFGDQLPSKQFHLRMRRQKEGGRSLANDYVGWNGEVPVWAETIKTFLPFSVTSIEAETNPLIDLLTTPYSVCKSSHFQLPRYYFQLLTIMSEFK